LIGIGASGASLPSLPDISTGKDSGKGASKGSNESWEQKGIKYAEHAVKVEASCLIASRGQVQQFLTNVPCRSLRRYIFAGVDVSGDTGVVSLVKVEMYDKAQAIQFKISSIVRQRATSRHSELSSSSTPGSRLPACTTRPRSTDQQSLRLRQNPTAVLQPRLH
jgi:hypothetical protein